jgi:hypothetical protein
MIAYHARVRIGTGRAIHRVMSNVENGRVVIESEVTRRFQTVPVERITRILPDVCTCIYCR